VVECTSAPPNFIRYWHAMTMKSARFVNGLEAVDHGSEVRGQKSAVSGQRSEVGSQRAEAGLGGGAARGAVCLGAADRLALRGRSRSDGQATDPVARGVCRGARVGHGCWRGLLAVGALLVWVMSGLAANVGPEGYFTSFDTQPVAADWATYGRSGASNNVYDMDADINAYIGTNWLVSRPLARTNDPPASGLQAIWSSTGLYLQTRPNNCRYTLLAGKFVNATGTNATEIRISYRYTIVAGGVPEEPDKGTRVYYSLTGLTNSWVNLPALNSTASENGSVIVTTNLAINWPNGSSLFILWADDDSSEGEDAGNQIDDFSLAVTAGELEQFSVRLTAPTNRAAFLSGTVVTASALIRMGRAPYTVEYFTNAGLGNTVFASAGTATEAPYTLTLGALPVGAYNVYAVATDSSSPAQTVYSATNTFFVADPMSVTLTAPAPDATFDYRTPVVGSATVAGGTAPYAVQFYLDNVAQGAPLTVPPFEYNFGPLTPGDHTIRVTVQDAAGWRSNSAVHTVHVIGPLTAMLQPADGTSYNYGQALRLTATLAWGTAPFTLTFLTNGDPAGVLAAEPWVLDLGVVPVGVYTCVVHVIDSTLPTPQEAFSSTNVITILDNPLSVVITSPADGQKVSQGAMVSAELTVGPPVTARVEFFLDGVSLGVDTSPPYAVSLGNPSLGLHSLYALATDTLGRQAYSPTNWVTVIPPTGGLVGTTGYTNSFAVQPPASEWATVSRAGAAADTYDMDQDVNAMITASAVTNRTVASEENPPAANASATWSSAGGYLQTRPTGNRYTVLMGKFQNDSGTNATQITISYQLTIAAGGTGEDSGMGTRVYYSLTGATGSWVNLPAFSTTTSENTQLLLSTNLTLNWPNGASLFLAWVDDNASATGIGIADPAQQIDNFFIGITAGTPVRSPLQVSLVSPTNGADFLGPAAIRLEAAASSDDGTVTNVTFLADGIELGQLTASPWRLDWVAPPLGLHNLSAVAADDQGRWQTSAPISIVVYDAAGSPWVQITSPPDGTQIEGPTNLWVSAFASAPAGVTNVQFWANDQLIGETDTSPYAVLWSAPFGSSTLQAVAFDALGRSGTSAPVRVTITIPPTNTVAPTILGQMPPAGATVSNLTSILVIFSERVVGVDASDLLINGVPATRLTRLGGEPEVYLFEFRQPAYGLVRISWAADHGITDIGWPAALPFDATAPGVTWTYELVDRTPPSILARFPAAGSIVTNLTQITVVFTEPVAGVDASDLLINGMMAREVSGSGVTYTFSFDPPPEGTVTVSWSATHGITDLASPPNPFDATAFGATWTYTLGIPFQTGNDNFANSILLPSTPASVRSSNVGATTESGEPLGGGFLQRGATVWWSWVAPTNGSVRVDTFGSSFNTGLGIFRGTAVNALTQVAFNDNAPGRSDVSLVTFTAQAGTTYHIQVSGMPGFGTPPATGSIQLNLSMPPSVSLSAPTNNSVVMLGQPIELVATASAVLGAVMQVDFYRGGTYVGSANTAPYRLVVENVPPGTNSFYAVAWDSAGQSTTSSTVNVLVANLGVTIVSPPDGTSFLTTNPITVRALTALPSGSITNVQFFVNGELFGESAGPSFSATWSNVVPGSHRFTARGWADTGASYDAYPVNIAVARALVASNSVWKYLDDGSDQGTAWIAPDFDDSTWASGPAPLGYGDSSGRPPLTTNSFGPDPNNKFVTTYYRQSFEVTNLAGYERFQLNIQRDDGAIVYLNGVELARFNMPAGPVTYTTYAAATAIDDGATTYSMAVDRAFLREGINVFAVEIHQDSANSSDIWFVMELLGVPPIIRNQAPVVSLTSPTNDAYFLAPTSLVLEATATDLDGVVTKVEFFADGQKLGEVSAPPYTLVWDAPPVGAHVLTAVGTDELGAQGSSAPVSIAVYDAAGTPLVQITTPPDGYTVEGPTNVAITASAHAIGGVAAVLFLADDRLLGQDTTAPYGLLWEDVPFGSHVLSAVACDAHGFCATSAPVHITLTVPPTNTVPPMIYTQIPPAGATVTNLRVVQVVFTERVVGVDAADLLINDVPATNVVGSGSNYVFYFPQPAYGTVRIRFAPDHGITDVGWPSHLPFDETDEGASWTYELIDVVPPVIVARTPAPGSTVTNLTEISVTFSEPVAGVDAADLLVNGVPAYDVDGSGANYVFAVSQPPSGTITVSWATNHGIHDLAPAQNLFNAAGSGASWSFTLDAKTILIASNSLWRFVKGTNEPSDPPDAWRLLSFDDSAWTEAPAPFFYGDPYSNGVPAYTLLSDMRSNYTCIYLRKSFYLPKVTGITNLYLRAQIDDGMIVWINGVEVLRTNVAEGDIPYTGTALGAAQEPTQTGAAYVNYRLRDPRDYLIAGTNVIAVHALNESLEGSSDFGFNAELFTYQTDTEAVAPHVAAKQPEPGYVLALTNIIVTFSEPVTNVDAADLLINGVPATEVINYTNLVFVFSFPQPAFGPVNISWAPDHGIVDLDVVPKPFNAALPSSTWGYVLLNPNAPYLVGINPPPGATLTNLNNISLAFSEPVTGVDAADLLINGVPASLLTVVGTNFIFMFPQPAYGQVVITWATNHGIQDLETPANEFDPSWPGHTWVYTLLDRTPPAVATVTPPPNSSVLNLTQVTITFTEPVTGVDAVDLLINGRPARAVTGSGDTYTFSFPQPNASSVVLSWAANHGIRDLADVPNLFDATAPGASWWYSTEDTVAPSVVRISPAPYLILRRLTNITVWFDEPVVGVEANDLLINGQPAQQVAGDGAGPYVFSFVEPPTGLAQVAWAPWHGIMDNADSPNPFAGGAWAYEINPGIVTEFAVRHVIHLSVDGFGSYYLGPYVSNFPSLFPNFRRLFDEGACTLNARCDYTYSITIPNHSSQLTGRPTDQPAGWVNTTHHGVTFDSDNGQTIHNSGNTRVPYKASVFDVVHDRGLSTAFLYSKQSLTFLVRSWSSGGGPDLIGDDDGTNKIDRVLNSVTSGNYGPSSTLVDELVAAIRTNGLWRYTFMHWTELDQYGHQNGWGSTTYSNQTRMLDEQLGRIFDALAANPEVGNWTVLIMVADHGGTGTGHFDATDPRTYSIPFCLWGAGIPAGVDAYSLFANRADPGTNRIPYSSTSVPLPLYGTDVGNLATTLLGLPPIPGSTLIPVFKGQPEFDLDGDGMPEAWEVARGLDPADPTDAGLDTDLDGLSNLQEYLAGTEPRDARSVLRLTALRSGGQFSFSAAPHRSYSVLWREGVGVGRWAKLADVEAAVEARQVTIVDPLPLTEGRLYQVVTPQLAGPAPALPAILRSPRACTVDCGGQASFEVLAVGNGLLSYQWLFNGTELLGATGPTLTITNVGFGHIGLYAVRVSDAAGSETSVPATLLVRPRIVQQPQSQVVRPGERVVFQVVAEGCGPLGYLWWRNGQPLTGQTNAELVLPAVQLEHAGEYRVSVFHDSAWGRTSVISSNALLTLDTSP
jgi:hypothetical protein